jgi:hypothetical protein
MATTTPNFGWPVPTSTDLVKDGATAIEALGDGIDASLLDLKGGTSGQVLKKNSNTDMDFIWSADSAGMTNPMTTTGDTIYSSSGSTPARLGIGSTGQVLTVAAGLPSWATPAVSTPTFVGCSLFTTSNPSIPNATYTKIAFDSELLDTNGFHSNTVNNTRVTIPTGYAGKYLITINCLWAGAANGVRQMRVDKNGGSTALFQTGEMAGGGNFVSNPGSFIADLAVGDYLELLATQNSGGSLTIYVRENEKPFCLQYLGA